jgi:hypothetical protein
MKHSTKLFLWIVGGFGTLFVLAIVAMMIVISRGGSGVLQEAANADAEGKRLGALIDAGACVDTAFARHARGQGRSLMAIVAERILLQNCLSTSRPVAGLCDSVPPPTQFMKAGAWAALLCRNRRLDDFYCPQLPGEVVNYCGRKRVR